jgi:hypothetical protein
MNEGLGVVKCEFGEISNVRISNSEYLKQLIFRKNSLKVLSLKETLNVTYRGVYEFLEMSTRIFRPSAPTQC